MPNSNAPLFPTRTGGPPEHRLRRMAPPQIHDGSRSRDTRRWQDEQVTPHVLRHTAAMLLREAGVDISTIALWMGHESIASTQIYLHADLALKQRALDRTTPPGTTPARYKPPDPLLAFLQSL